MKLAIPLLLMFASVAVGATDPGTMDPNDDFSPMLLPIAFLGVCIMLIVVGVGIVIGLTIIASIAVLTALGIVSTATLIGLARRRFSSGLRALHYQVMAVAAMPAGIGIAWLSAHFRFTHFSGREILVTGSIGGVIGGLLFAFALDRLAKLVYRRLG